MQYILEGILCGFDESTALSAFNSSTTEAASRSGEVTDDLRHAILEPRGAGGLSMITPKVYLPLHQGKKALIDAIYGLLKDDRNGVPIWDVVKKGDPERVNAPWVMATVSAKFKTDGSVKVDCV